MSDNFDAQMKRASASIDYKNSHIIHTNRCPIMEQPNEILTQILVSIPWAKDLISTLKVCKLFYWLVKSDKELNDIIEDSKMCHIINLVSEISTFRFECVASSEYKLILDGLCLSYSLYNYIPNCNWDRTRENLILKNNIRIKRTVNNNYLIYCKNIKGNVIFIKAIDTADKFILYDKIKSYVSKYIK